MARPRKPTAIHKASGNYRKDRHGGRLELPPEAPKSFRTLRGRALLYWNAFAEYLSTAGILAKVDGEALSRWCVLCAAFDSEKKIDRRLKISAALDRLGTQFGLNPVSRTKIMAQADTKRKPPPASDTPILRIAE